MPPVPADIGGLLERPSRSLRVMKREVLGLARHIALLPRDIVERVPRALSPGDDVVVLVHGLFSTAGVLRPLREELARAPGLHCASFTYPSGPGVEALASRLAALVRRLPRGVRVHLVGHSLGGIVARWYVVGLGGDPRIAQTISIASPFRGTRHARLLPSAACRDIEPSSRLLSRLREQEHVGPGWPPHVSIVAAADHLVTESEVHNPGEVVVLHDYGHIGILFSAEIGLLVRERVLGSRGPAGCPQPAPGFARVRTGLRGPGGSAEPGGRPGGSMSRWDD